MLGNKTGDDMKIFSGNANPDLAREIAAYLGTQVVLTFNVFKECVTAH